MIHDTFRVIQEKRSWKFPYMCLFEHRTSFPPILKIKPGGGGVSSRVDFKLNLCCVQGSLAGFMAL